MPPTLLAYLLLALALVAGSGSGAAAARRHRSPANLTASGNPVYIWPLPKNFTSGTQTLAVDPDLALDAQGPGGGAAAVAEAFQRYRSLIFSPWAHAARPAAAGYDVATLTVVVASADETLELGVDESYTIYIAAAGGVNSIVGGATIEANTIYGAIRGLETFSQLCVFNYDTKNVEVRSAPWYIQDEPRFSFRGLLLDTSRHYYPVDVIEQVIDSMSFANLNVLHWHIIDEQSFPLEIPSYPNLWKGSYSKLERYTVEDAQYIVSYAKKRGIHVMAEIDVPGHAESWGNGYPKLWPSPSCTEPLDVSSNFTFEVISGILSDMRKIFPFGLFHLGGDEVYTEPSKASSSYSSISSMAKFSFADADAADEDHPPPADADAGGGDKRKRHGGGGGPDDGAGGGGPSPKARKLERAVEGDGGCGREVRRVGGDGDAAGISMRIDPDLLDCSICFEPLCPPLYQCQNGHVACLSCWSRLNNKCHVCSHDAIFCQNGHVACFSCWSRLSNKCHICSHNAIFARNIALEKIVESIKSSCIYAKWGCCELVSYVQRNTHEESCLVAPSKCPIPGCGCRGFTGCWSGHFLVDHSADCLHFVYGQFFEVNLEASLAFLVLLGEDDHLFLLLNKNIMPFGHAFSVVCLRTGNLNWKFSYEIKAASKGNPENCLQLKASVTNTKEWGGVHPTEAFLLVPYDFCSSGNLTLDVSVARSASV